MTHDEQFLVDDCKIQQGLEAEGAGLRAVLGACEGPPPIRGHAEDIATQMAYFGLESSVRTTVTVGNR